MKKKKFLTATLSMLLAGGMAFGVAACGNGGGGGGGGGEHAHKWSTTGTDNGDGTHKLTCSGEGTCDSGGTKNENHNTSGTGGACSVCGHTEAAVKKNQALLDAIDATIAAENYQMKVSMDAAVELLFNGEPIAADTVLVDDPDMPITGLTLAMMLTGDKTLTEMPEVIMMSDGELTYDFDFTNGKAKITEYSVYDDETEIEYYEVDGTTINNYWLHEVGSWYDPDDKTYSPMQHSYTGYADNATAKAIFKSTMPTMIEGATLEAALKVIVATIPDGKMGTLEELIEEFDYDATTKTYTATVNASSMSSMYSKCTVGFTVADGKITDFVMSVDAPDGYFDDMLDELPVTGLSIGSAKMISGIKYGNFGTTSIQVPADYKGAEAENIHTTPVISTETAWKAMLADFGTEEFALSYTLGSTNYDYYVSTELEAVLQRTQSYYQSYSDLYLVRAEDDKLVPYSPSSYSYGSPEDFVKGTETAFTGDAIKAINENFFYDDYITDYMAGFGEGALKDLFAKFEYCSFTTLKASLKLNGKDVEVSVSFSYDGDAEKYYANVRVSYSGTSYFSVDCGNHVQNEISYYIDQYIDNNND